MSRQLNTTRLIQKISEMYQEPQSFEVRINRQRYQAVGKPAPLTVTFTDATCVAAHQPLDKDWLPQVIGRPKREACRIINQELKQSIYRTLDLCPQEMQVSTWQSMDSHIITDLEDFSELPVLLHLVIYLSQRGSYRSDLEPVPLRTLFGYPQRQTLFTACCPKKQPSPWPDYPSGKHPFIR